MNLCKSTFPNSTARHSTEERAAESWAFKATWTKKRLDENRADFDRGKKVFFYIEKF